MKVLVTGANGFIGSNLIRSLLAGGADVRAFIKPGTPEGSLAGVDVEKIYGDLSDLASLERAVRGCMEVYHLAAYNKLWAGDPSIFPTVNSNGTENILHAALRNNIRRIVHTSTCDIIGLKQRSQGREGTEEDFPESEAELPGPYGRSKWLAERAVLAYATKGMDCVIVNPTIPVGPYDSAPTEPGRLIRKFLTGKLGAFVNTTMNFVDVKDCAEGHMLAMEKGRSGERYILGGKNIHLAEFFLRLEELTGVHGPEMRVPYPLAYPGVWVMNQWSRITGIEPPASVEGLRLIRHSFAFSSQKAEQELGYRPADITDALRAAVEWHLKAINHRGTPG